MSVVCDSPQLSLNSTSSSPLMMTLTPERSLLKVFMNLKIFTNIKLMKMCTQRNKCEHRTKISIVMTGLWINDI